MPTQIPSTFSSLSAGGVDDETYITMLRDDMDDPPIPVAETFGPVSLTPFVRLNQYPVYDADNFLSVFTKSFGGSGSNNGVGVTFQQVAGRKLITQSTQCYVEPETGYIYFQDNSVTGSLVVFHYKVRFTNRRMLNALYAGLKAMFPRVWQRKTFVFQAMTNQYEYQLPQEFLDPRTHIFRVEFQEIPFGTERYHVVNGVTQTNLNQLKVPWSQGLTPGANIRITYAAPYASLSDLEPQVQHLPLWYAKGKLLMDKEVLRARYDLGPVSSNEQQNPPGISQNAGVYHMQQFERELNRLQRPLPVAAPRSVYSR